MNIKLKKFKTKFTTTWKYFKQLLLIIKSRVHSVNIIPWLHWINLSAGAPSAHNWKSGTGKTFHLDSLVFGPSWFVHCMRFFSLDFFFDPWSQNFVTSSWKLDAIISCLVLETQLYILVPLELENPKYLCSW
jgi:hypothetical protein